ELPITEHPIVLATINHIVPGLNRPNDYGMPLAADRNDPFILNLALVAGHLAANLCRSIHISAMDRCRHYDQHRGIVMHDVGRVKPTRILLADEVGAQPRLGKSRMSH